MPEWLHARAEHLLAKNPSMSKSMAFAIATQQAHKLGKTPKGYGTAAGRKAAKVKYNKPKSEYTKRSNPGGLDSPKLASMKLALVERLARLAATDIPKTPRLLMRKRSPSELAAIQHGITDKLDAIKAPAKRVVNSVADKVPTGLGKKLVRHSGHMLVDNPDALAAAAVPFPGVAETYILAKKGLERAIDRVAPAHGGLRKVAFTESQYSGGTTMGPPVSYRSYSGMPGASSFPVQQLQIKRKLAGPPPSEEGELAGRPSTKIARAMMNAIEALGEYQAKQANVISPKAQLTSSQKVGLPRKSSLPGPSIADLSKPQGYGQPIAGAVKSGVM